MATTGPLAQEVIAVSSSTIRGCQREQAELKGDIDRLAPTWRERRSVLSDLNRVLGTANDRSMPSETAATGRGGRAVRAVVT